MYFELIIKNKGDIKLSTYDFCSYLRTSGFGLPAKHHDK